jgi:bifunctional non-homologous end joining protein LigD
LIGTGARSTRAARRQLHADLPTWVQPQLCKLVKDAPDEPEWLHEIKFDGYRMHARLDRGGVRLLTRKGLDWTQKYPAITEALKTLPASRAYLDGELCGVRPDGTTSFDMIQAASEPGNAAALVFFVFDLLFVDGEDLTRLPLVERKPPLAELLSGTAAQLHYSDHQAGRGLASTNSFASAGWRGSFPSVPTRLTCRAIAGYGVRPSA